MAESISITIESDDEDVPEPSFIRQVIHCALERMNQAGAEVNVQVVTQAQIHALNKQYRGKDKPTNVLSFPMELPQWIDDVSIGDIVVCPRVIRQEAASYQQALKARWAHMLIHGTLHLLGMDHQTQQQQNEMEAMELKILSQLGYDNPYQIAL